MFYKADLLNCIFNVIFDDLIGSRIHTKICPTFAQNDCKEFHQIWIDFGNTFGNVSIFNFSRYITRGVFEDFSFCLEIKNAAYRSIFASFFLATRLKIIN